MQNESDLFSQEARNKLLFVSKKILTKVELTTSKSGSVCRFDVSSQDLPLKEWNLVIKKLQSLELVTIFDEKYIDVLPVSDPVSYQLIVNKPHLRDFISHLEGKELSQDRIEWPENYKWNDDGLSFLVAIGKGLSFQKKNNYRWKVFDCLAKQRGNWVRVSVISDESGVKKESTVRTIINQLRDKIRDQHLTKYLKIESLGNEKLVAHGSYRVVPA